MTDTPMTQTPKTNTITTALGAAGQTGRFVSSIRDMAVGKPSVEGYSGKQPEQSSNRTRPLLYRQAFLEKSSR
jgi:hypothetical protein